MITKFLNKRLCLTENISFLFRRRKETQREKVRPFNYIPLPQTKVESLVSNIRKFGRKKPKTEITVDRYSLDPHTYWITQGKGTERPFTGKYWDTKDHGHYECVVCANTVFSSDEKYFPPTGVASFWRSVPKSVYTIGDIADLQPDTNNLTTKLQMNEEIKKRVVCSRCKSHLGTLHHDGPPPTFKRFSINSAALKFFEKPWFHPPHYYRKQREDAEKIRFKKKRDKFIAKKEWFSVDVSKIKEIDTLAKVPDSNLTAIQKEKMENSNKK